MEAESHVAIYKIQMAVSDLMNLNFKEVDLDNFGENFKLNWSQP